MAFFRSDDWPAVDRSRGPARPCQSVHSWPIIPHPLQQLRRFIFVRTLLSAFQAPPNNFGQVAQLHSLWRCAARHEKPSTRSKKECTQISQQKVNSGMGYSLYTEAADCESDLTSRTEDDERSYAASAGIVGRCHCIDLASLKSLVHDILLRGLSLEKPVQCHAKERSLVVQGLLINWQTGRPLYALINVFRYQHLHVYAYLPPQDVLCEA